MFSLDELAIFPSHKSGGSCSISSARLYEQTSGVTSRDFRFSQS
jgi:hypothetical protein